MGSTTQCALSIAIPNKGRLSDPAVDLLRRAGVSLEAGNGRRLFQDTWSGRLRVLYVRAQDIPELVQDGRADLGITGLDLVLESRSKVRRLLDLKFGSCRLVLAVPSQRRNGNGTGSIATSFPNLTRDYLRRRGQTAQVIPVSGATELMPHIGVAEAVVDLTATGSTLAVNELVEVDCLLESTAWMIANPAALRNGKRALVEEFQFALETVVEARGKRYLMMDLPTERLGDVRSIVPGVAGPTVMDIYGDPTMKAVHVVVDEARVYEAMRQLRDLGARGILVVPIDRMVA